MLAIDFVVSFSLQRKSSFRDTVKENTHTQTNQAIMGGWVLEVAKMALYLSFPVAAFHIFNSPQYFEQYVIEKKREMYPNEDQLYYDELSLLLRDMNSGNLDQKIQQLNAIEKDRKDRADAKSNAN